MLSNLGPDPILIIIRKVRPMIAARWIIVRARLRPAPPRHYVTPDWKFRGLCAQLAVEESDPLFFGIEVREAPAKLIAAANGARQICRRCPVAALCLTDALETDQRYGVWGGTSGRQREKMQSRIAAGTPIAAIVAETFPTRISA